ncbi:MAG: hypothetical protein JSV04_00025 [Candidatus Heimdallarchaeota archaeon]|nr:MAG: hypothetical protein JSV04_00025 [Candidatus Heimdallarchaeota archaeon]
MTEIAHFEEEIVQEAKQQAKEILQQAEKEATEILEQARTEALRIRQKVMHEKEKEEEQRFQSELSRLRIKNKIDFNNAKESILEETFTQSWKRIQEWRELKSKEYRTALAKLIIQGGTSLEGGELTVQLAREDFSLIDTDELESEITKASGIKSTIKVSKADDDIVDGGVIVFKGPLAVNNTVQAIFDRRENIIRKRLHNILFSD